MVRKLTVIILVLCFSGQLFGQIASSCEEDFRLSFPDQLCLNESITYSPVQSDVFFDFCPGELNNVPLPASTTDLSEVRKIRGMKFIRDESGAWYGFFTSRDNNVLLRASYGNSLDNSPVITNLGNIGGLFSNPEAVEIVNWNGQWYGYVHNTNTANIRVIALDFNGSLSNNPSGEILIENVGSPLTSMMALIEDNDLHLVLTNFIDNTLTILNLGDPAGGTVNSQFNTSPLPETSGMTDINLIKTCGTWKGLVTVFNSRTAKWVEFQNGLMNNPVTRDIGFNAFNGFRPYNGDFTYEDDIYYLTITSFNGTVFKLSFEAANPPVSSIWNQVATISDDVRISSIVKSQSTWNHYFVNETTGILTRATYPDPNCLITSPIADQADLSSIRFEAGGMKRFSYSGQLSDGSYYSQVDSIYFFNAPEISVGVENGCLNEATKFTSEVSFEFGSSVTYLWDFDDPGSSQNTSTMPNPSHTFENPGTYNVTAQVSDECGVTTTREFPITVYPEGQLSPDFSTQALLCSNQSLQFTDESQSGLDAIVSWEWDFDGLGTSSDQNPEFTFTSAGSYLVQLTIGGEFNCKKSITKTINVLEGPDPSFTVDDACQGTLMQFSNTTTGQVSSYLWDFGNGVTSTLENPEVEFDADGQYPVTLTVTNAAGCVSTYHQTVTVYSLPEVQFANDLACERTETFFRDESFAANANIIDWQWDFGDPDSENNTATGQETTHIFSSAGTYDVTLTVTTNFGCQSTASQTVTVLESPTAAFSYEQACVGEPVRFQDNSFPPEGESLTSWAWDLGGTFSSQRNPTTTFEFARSYDITLSVTASNQCIATETVELVVPEPPQIRIGIQQACAENPVTFIDLTENPADPVAARSWDFAGIGLSSDSVAQFTFDNAGTYVVSLTLTMESGCSYTRSQNVEIGNAPVASFDLEEDFGPPPFLIQAASTSENAASLVWLLDDTEIGNEQELTYEIEEFGTYELALVAFGSTACRDTARQIIQVTPPELDIAVSDLEVTPVTGVPSRRNLSFTVRNAGTLVLTTLPVTVILDADYEFTQEIEVTLPPDNSPVRVDFPVELGARDPLNVCVRVPEVFMKLRDLEPENNTACASEQDVVAYAPFPNPADQLVSLEVLTTSDQPVGVEVYSASGGIRFSGTIATGRNGLHTISLDTSEWAAGAYIIRVSSTSGTEHYRLVIQH